MTGPIEPIEIALTNARSSRDGLQFTTVSTSQRFSSSSPAMNVTNCYTTPSTSAEAQLSSHAALLRGHVNSLRESFAATKRMVTHALVNGDKHISSKCVSHFPQSFPGNPKSQLKFSSWWWNDIQRTMSLKERGIRKEIFI